MFVSSAVSIPGLGTEQSPLQWAVEFERPGREAAHSPQGQEGQEVKNMWLYTSSP
jgi:hypothetical protein